jgi:hypothetical protein
MKAGFISKAAEKRLSKISAYAEAAGYAANIALNLHRLRVMQLQRLMLVARLMQRRKVRGLFLGWTRLLVFGTARVSQVSHEGLARSSPIVMDDGVLPGVQTVFQLPPSHPGPGPNQFKTPTPAELLTGRAPQDGGPPDPEILRQLAALRSAHVLRTAFVVQDLADGLIALSDITDGRYERMSHPIVLALAGLVSAAVSSYKNWDA